MDRSDKKLEGTSSRSTRGARCRGQGLAQSRPCRRQGRSCPSLAGPRQPRRRFHPARLSRAERSLGSRPCTTQKTSRYSTDHINSAIVGVYAEPAFGCHLRWLAYPDDGNEYPLIEVPGGHTVPIRCKKDGPKQQHVKRNTYYIRRPGPTSEPPRSGSEWDRLVAPLLSRRARGHSGGLEVSSRGLPLCP